MATELVFSGGERVTIIGTNAETLLQTLNLPAEQVIRGPNGQMLAPVWTHLQTPDGTIFVNPAQVAQVAYVEDVADVEEQPDVLEQVG
jgi:hypothetical protein